MQAPLWPITALESSHDNEGLSHQLIWKGRGGGGEGSHQYSIQNEMICPNPSSKTHTQKDPGTEDSIL